MKRLTYIFLALWLSVFGINAEEIQSSNAINGRPKVAVVLAGGGAKGTAHLGALKVIEECGIPIDMVVGTSMGAIVGGLYSIGYTSNEIHNIVRDIDWINLILDTPNFGNQLLTSKKDQESYLLRVSLDRARVLSGTSRGGIIHGNNISAVFTYLTNGVPDDCNFNDFPIPFACVATDALSGSKYVFQEGSIVTAMRSSMALPTIFTPVKVGEMALVDGGIVDNYPVDVARAMGADIVIGIDLVNEISDEELANSAMAVLGNLLDLISEKQYAANKKDTDLYIPVNTTGFSAASFSTTSIDTLIMRGESAARKLQNELQSLADRLGVKRNVALTRHGRLPNVDYKNGINDFSVKAIEKGVSNTAVQTVQSVFQSGTLSLGARFDNQNYASLQVGIDLRLLRKRRVGLNLYGRLGARMVGGVTIDHPFYNGGKIEAGYTIDYRDMTYYFKGTKLLSFGDYHHQFDIRYNQEWRNVAYSFGAQYDVDHYRNQLYHSTISGNIQSFPTDRYFTYYVKAEFNSLNAMYFPSKGSQVELKGEMITNNFYKYRGKIAIPILSGYWRSSIALTSRFNLIPHASIRMIIKDEDRSIPMALDNFIGGLHRGMWIDQQIEMAGLRHMELSLYDNIYLGGIDFQQRIGSNHFVIISADGASDFNYIDDAFLSENTFWGFNIGYHYRGVAGPISLIGMWNSRARQFGVTLNVGYYF